MRRQREQLRRILNLSAVEAPFAAPEVKSTWAATSMRYHRHSLYFTFGCLQQADRGLEQYLHQEGDKDSFLAGEARSYTQWGRAPAVDHGRRQSGGKSSPCEPSRRARSPLVRSGKITIGSSTRGLGTRRAGGERVRSERERPTRWRRAGCDYRASGLGRGWRWRSRSRGRDWYWAPASKGLESGWLGRPTLISGSRPRLCRLLISGIDRSGGSITWCFVPDWACGPDWTR